MISFKTGRPFRKETLYFGQAYTSSGSCPFAAAFVMRVESVVKSKACASEGTIEGDLALRGDIVVGLSNDESR